MHDDTSSSNKTKLPKYARHADPSRLVYIVCKGDCAGSAWAEMAVDYPGWDVMWRSQVGDFEAKCLRCGKIARDPYNWVKNQVCRGDKSGKSKSVQSEDPGGYNRKYLAMFNDLAGAQEACLSRVYEREKRLAMPNRHLTIIGREYTGTLATIDKIRSYRLNCERDDVRQRLDKQIKKARAQLQCLAWLHN